MIAVITAIYDRYDELKPILPQSVDVDWVCVTDDPDLADVSEYLGWRIVYRPEPNMHPNRAAKWPKMLPWWYTEADQSVWVDASFRVMSPTFATEAMSFADPIAQFKHPWRDCVYDEAFESSRLTYKYDPEEVNRQIQVYCDQRFPRNWGLWATGVIARQHTFAVQDLGHTWLNECLHHSFQDQVSQPVMLFQSGLRPSEFPGNHLANRWVRYEGSGRH